MVLPERVPLFSGGTVGLLWMSRGYLSQDWHRLFNGVLGHRPQEQGHMGSERSMTSGSDRPGVSLGPPWPAPVSLGKSHNP